MVAMAEAPGQVGGRAACRASCRVRVLVVNGKHPPVWLSRGMLESQPCGGYRRVQCHSNESNGSRSLASERHLFVTEPSPAPADDSPLRPAVPASGTTDGGMTMQPFGRQASSAYWKLPYPWVTYAQTSTRLPTQCPFLRVPAALRLPVVQ